MPMVDTGEKAQPVCHAARASEAGRARGTGRAQLAPPPATGAFRRPVMAAAIRGPQQGLASRAGGWVRAMKKGGENPALPVLML